MTPMIRLQTNIERYYRNHMKKHGRFNCGTCDMSFVSRKRLKVHVRRNHGGIGSKKKYVGKNETVRTDLDNWIDQGLVEVEEKFGEP